MQPLADQQLWSRVTAADTRHVHSTLLRGQRIGARRLAPRHGQAAIMLGRRAFIPATLPKLRAISPATARPRSGGTALPI